MMDSIKNIAFKTEFYEPLGVDLYFFNKSDLSCWGELHHKLLGYCDMVQEGVWKKKYEGRWGNESEGCLVLAWDKKQKIPVAFFNSGFFILKGGCFVYHYNCMILNGYRNRGLLRYYFEEVNYYAQKNWPHVDIINITGTGYLPVFNIFENSNLFIRMPWPCEDAILGVVRAIVEADCRAGVITEDGIIRSVWRKQQNDMKDVWPKHLSAKFGFPDSVNYFDGDILLRLYKYNKGV